MKGINIVGERRVLAFVKQQKNLRNKARLQGKVSESIIDVTTRAVSYEAGLRNSITRLDSLLDQSGSSELIDETRQLITTLARVMHLYDANHLHQSMLTINSFKVSKDIENVSEEDVANEEDWYDEMRSRIQNRVNVLFGNLSNSSEIGEDVKNEIQVIQGYLID